MAPPRLSAQSAERMKQVVDRADALVDSGTNPNAAIAKAASELHMPVGHVDIVVHAFNTGRAVRQLGESDPWTKAASHPVATTDGVMAELTGTTPRKQAADLSHYRAAPTTSTNIPVSFMPLVKKQASAPAPAAPVEPAAPPVRKQAVDSRLSAQRAAVEALDQAVQVATALPPAKYIAAKQAAMSLFPDTAGYLFKLLEENYPSVYLTSTKQAAFDPTVTVNHPLVQAVKKLDDAKKAHVAPEADTVPYGYERHPGTSGMLVLRKLATCPVLGTPLIAEPKQAEAPKERDPLDFDLPKAAAGPPADPDGPVTKTIDMTTPNKYNALFPSVIGRAVGTLGYGDDGKDTLTRVNARGERENVPGAVAGFKRGLRTVGNVNNAPFGLNKLVGPWTDHVTVTSPGPKQIRERAVGDLPAAMDRVDQHAAIQGMLSDPRFMSADPKTIVDTYRDLSNLAPSAMRNRSLAADFIQRRLQTGPLQYFDMKTLTEIEKNLASARKDRDAEDD